MPNMQIVEGAGPMLMTVSEVAAELRVDPSTVYKWLSTGVLPCVRFAGSVRVRADALAAFVTATEGEKPMNNAALRDMLRTPPGRRVLIAVPNQVREHPPVAKATEHYEGLIAGEKGAQQELEALGQQLKQAEAAHLLDYANAIAAGKPEPSETKTIKLRDEHAKLGRRLAATTLAIDTAEAELAATVVAERERLLADVAEQEQAAVERTRAAVEELAEARSATMSARALRGWLIDFPAGASRSVTAATPPVRGLPARNSEPTPFTTVIDALLAEITPPAPAGHATAAGF